MQEIILNAAFRDSKDNVDALRADGLVPAVVYGKKQEAKSIVINAKDLTKALHQAGESSVVTLKTPSGDINTLIHAYDLDPVKNVLTHADFLAIDMNKEVEVALVIEFTGEAPAEKQGLGVLTKALHEIEIKALPKDLPHNIEVDISSLTELGSQIHAKDLKMPKGVTMLTDADEVVAVISSIKEEVEETAPVDLSTIEISEERGKKAEEGEEESK
jgi:large subunit ribosomal protein L25